MIILADIPAWLTVPNWVEFATLGGIILVSLFTLVKVIDARYWRAGRTYTMSFLQSPDPFPPTPAFEQRYYRSVRKHNGSEPLYVRVRAKHGIEIRDVEIQFVQRTFRWRSMGPFDLWMWDNAPVSVIQIEKATDVYAANFAMAEEPHQHEQANQIGGSRIWYDRPNALLLGDSLWLRIQADVKSDWKGHLQFRGPSPHGRRAYVRRTVDMLKPAKQGSDTADSPSQASE